MKTKYTQVKNHPAVFSTETWEMAATSISYLIMKKIKDHLSIGGILIIWFLLMGIERCLLFKGIKPVQPDIPFIYIAVDLLSVGYFYYYGLIKKSVLNFRYLSRCMQKVPPILTYGMILWFSFFAVIDIYIPTYKQPNSTFWNFCMIFLNFIVLALIGFNEYDQCKRKNKRRNRKKS